MIVINDVHIAANRTAGTTPASAAELRQYTLGNLSSFLDFVDEDLLVAGDLFDNFNVPNTDLLATYRIFDKWLLKGHKLYAMRGNHDASKDSSKLSSFDLLGALLEGRATFINEPVLIGNTYCLPHALNQDEFDLWISKVPACDFCVIHANYDNHFATQSDHSLNVSEDQAKASLAKTLVFAHEHAARSMLAGKVFVLGVQWPTSISDCLSRKDLHAHRLCSGGEIQAFQTWSRDNYKEFHWKDIEGGFPASFVRIVGHATPDEAAQVADTIAKYRRASLAFIVGNAVKIGEDSEMEEFSVQSLEQARAFDVMGALKGFLTEEEYKILEKLNA